MGYQAALIVLSTFSILLLIPPFVWHIKTVNIPAITLIIWLLLMSIKIFIDAIIWGSDDFASKYNGEGYCDVMVKLQVGANVGISSSVAGIMFNLYRILSANSVIPGLRSFKKISLDLSISLLTPLIVMSLNYLVQYKRYYILQYSGCQNVTALSWVTIVIYTVWMLFWSFVGVVFSALIIFTFFRKRKDVRDILKCTNSGLTLVRFSKLLIFCIMVILVMFPLSLYIFTDGINQVQDSYSFEAIHNKVTWFTITFVSLKTPYYTTWVYLALSYLVFIFFGLGSDAIQMYLAFLSKIGFKPIIDHFQEKRERKNLLKADKLVSNALGVKNNLRQHKYSDGTSFDLEMQRIISESRTEDKSPTSTNSTASNVFGDRNRINTPNDETHLKYFSGLNNTLVEFDEDDIDYLNMLYETDKFEGKRSTSTRKIPFQRTSPAKSELDNIGYSYSVQHKDPLDY